MFGGKVNRLLEIHTEPTPETTNYLTLQATQHKPVMTETLVKCEMRKEDGLQVLSFQGTVTPIVSFQEATGIWVAQSLVQDNDRISWVRLLNITKDEIMTYQNSRVAMLDPLDTGELTMHLKQKDDIAALEGLDFQKHVNLNGKHSTVLQLDNVTLLCQKYRNFFSRSSNYL